MFGLTPDNLRGIKKAFYQFPQIEKVLLYGSRAKGNYKDGSDIDITLLGKKLTLKIVYALETALEELYLPYTFDISIFSQIDNDDLIKHILTVGKSLYEKSTACRGGQGAGRDSGDAVREGWVTKNLGDVCGLQNGFAFKSKLFKPSGIPILRISNIQDEQICENRPVFTDPNNYKEDLSKYRVDDGDLLIAMSGATTGKVGFNRTRKTFLLNQRVGRFEPSSGLDIDYLFYFLSTKVEENLAISIGSAQPNLSTKQIKAFQIPLPPLSEQERIVAILDEAFAAIATATANAEKNLANARELFESELNRIFSQKGDGWVETTIGEQVQLQRGFDITKKQQRPGKVPVVSSGGSKSFHSEAKVSGPGIVIGRKGSIGSVYYIKEDFWPHDTTLWVKNFLGNNTRLVYYFFYGMDLKRLDSGAANPALNRNVVHPISVFWPPKDRQAELVRRFDDLSFKTEDLATIYRQKLTELAELKQSILQKAFAGELTGESQSGDWRSQESGSSLEEM